MQPTAAVWLDGFTVYMHANLGCQSYDWTLELCEAEQAHPRSCEVAQLDAVTDFAGFVSASEEKSLSTNPQIHTRNPS